MGYPPRQRIPRVYSITYADVNKEVQPGLWLPTKWTRTHRLGPPTDRSQWGKISWIEHYDVPLLEVNTKIPPETFEFKFPVGTTVANLITNGVDTIGAEAFQTILDADDLLSTKGAVQQTATPKSGVRSSNKTGGDSSYLSRRPDVPAGARPVAPAARLGPFDVLWRVLLGVAAISVLLGVWAAVRKKGRSAGGPSERS